MFSINNIFTSQGKPQVGRDFLPYMAMTISPWEAIDKYSDGTTDVNGIGILDANNKMYTESSGGLGYVSSTIAKLLPSGNELKKFFSYASRVVAHNGFLYYKFLGWFSKYKRYLSVNFYPIQKDITKIAEMTTVVSQGIIRQLSATKVLWVYVISSTSIGARVGTVGVDGTITWGAELALTTAGHNNFYDACEIATDKFIIVYRSTGFDLYATVCTVSGTTITAGLATKIIDNVTTFYPSVCKIDTDKFVAAINDNNTSLSLVACTVSGTTITSGTPVTHGASVSIKNLRADGTDAFVFTTGTNTTVYATAGIVSGTTITLGSAVAILTAADSVDVDFGNFYEHTKQYDTNKFFHFEQTSSGTYIGTFSRSGTTITALEEATPFDYGSAANSYAILEVTATSDYQLYLANGTSLKVTLSGDTPTLAYTSERAWIMNSSVLTTSVGVGKYPSINTYTNIISTNTYRGLGVVGNYLVLCHGSTSVCYYMTGLINSQYEFYNDDTIIGNARDCAEPFVLQTEEINSELYTEVAYLKVKNTSGATAGLVIETVMCEVE